MNPFNRNLVFAVSTILLLTVSAAEMLNMALLVLKITSIEIENEN